MLHLLTRPRRALVGEMERFVIMEGDEQIGIGRELEAGQFPVAIPAGWTDHDDARRIRLPDHAQQLGEERIPRRRVELGVRLVQKLEGDAARRVGEAWSNLAPEGRESFAAHRHVFRARIEIMLVENDPEARLLRLPDDIVELGEPHRIETVLGIHVAERHQGDPDEVEAGLADFSEVPPLEAALAGVGPIGIVTERVDAAAEGLVGRVEARCGRRSGDWRCGERGERDEECKSCFDDPHSGSLQLMRLVE